MCGIRKRIQFGVGPWTELSRAQASGSGPRGIYFSILQRKVLTPADTASLDDIAAQNPRLPGLLRGQGAAVRVEAHPRRSHQAPPTPGVEGGRTAARGGMNTSPNLRARALSYSSKKSRCSQTRRL